MKIKKPFVISLLLAFFVLSGLSAQQWGDYYFYSIQNSNKAYLLDNNGSTYHTWTFPSADKTGYSSYLLPGGDLLRTVKYTPNSFAGGGQTGKLQKTDWEGNVIWDFVYATTSYAMHHDICPMPNGNVLLIAYELKTAAQATLAGSAQSIIIWSEKIVEVRQTGATSGEVVWEWHLWDHLVQSHDPSKNNYVSSVSDHPERLNINYKTSKDWIHMNGIDYNPILDQIIFSSHNLNEIYVIDHSTTTQEAATGSGGFSGKGGDFLYRWGNTVAYGMGGTAVFNVVHDSHWIPENCPNGGRLVAFNNKGISNTKSSVDQVSAPLNGFNYTYTAGTAYQPLSYTERHACNGGSNSMGGSQQLPNGNMLVCVATSGLIYEVNSVGTTIWSKTLSGVCPKAYKYNACYLNGSIPVIPVITIADNTLVCDEAASYQWYFNGVLMPGEVNRTLTPVTGGVYGVRTSDSDDCMFSYSALLAFDVTTSINNIYKSDLIKIYPNPGSDIVSIETQLQVSGVSVCDLTGRNFDIAVKEKALDVSELPSGIYILAISTSSGTITKKLVRH